MLSFCAYWNNFEERIVNICSNTDSENNSAECYNYRAQSGTTVWEENSRQNNRESSKVKFKRKKNHHIIFKPILFT